jgi:hypothetical protein
MQGNKNLGGRVGSVQWYLLNVMGWRKSCGLPSLHITATATALATTCYSTTPALYHSIGRDLNTHFLATLVSLPSVIRCIPTVLRRDLMRAFRPYYRPIQRLALHQGQPRPSATQFHSGRRIKMSSQREDSIPHELRTAAEPRQNRLYPVRLSHVEQVNSSVRLLQFDIPPQDSSVRQHPLQSRNHHLGGLSKKKKVQGLASIEAPSVSLSGT